MKVSTIIPNHRDLAVRSSSRRQPEALRLVQHHHIPDQQEICDRWNRLVEQTESPEIFLTWQWARAVEVAYGESRRPWLLWLEDENRSLAGLAALAIDASGREVSFLADTTADYCDFLSPPDFRERIVEAVLEQCANLDAHITLANLPQDSASAAALRQAAGRYGYHLFERPAYRCAQVSLPFAEQREAFKASLRGKNRRRVINAMQRFSPQLEHLHSWEQVANELPHFVQAHVARFVAGGRTSNLAHPDRQRFLEELAKLLSDAGWLRMSCLRVDGRTVAWNYGFQFAGSWFWYQPALDPGFEKSSPGAYLLTQIITAACDDPTVTVVDLGLGTEIYKERFANSGRQTLHLTLTRSLAGHVRGITRYRSAQLIKRWPAGEQAIRRFLRRPV